MNTNNPDTDGQRYRNGMRPYLDLMKRVILPPRKPKGHPANYRRSIVMQAAIHQQKVRGDTKHDHRNCGLCRVRVKLLPVEQTEV